MGVVPLPACLVFNPITVDNFAGLRLNEGSDLKFVTFINGLLTSGAFRLCVLLAVFFFASVSQC